MALETVFGEVLPNASKGVLKEFVMTRVLNDPDITEEYSCTMDGLLGGRATNDYAVSIHRHALRKMFRLILFMDTAKEQG